MKETGKTSLLTACLVLLFLVSSNAAHATCITGEELPFNPDDAMVLRPQDRSPLEQQIAELEWHMQNYGRSTPLDDETFQQLKLELAELYDQLPRERNPLDDGSDACPATLIPAGIIPFVDYGTTIGAVNNFNPITPCGTTFAPDKIYRYVPDYTSTYFIDTFGSTYDTQLYVNTGGACPGNTQVACNDDMFGSQSQVLVTLNTGQEYFIIVDGFNNYSGNFVLRISGNCILAQSSSFQQECVESLNDPTHAAWDCNGGCNNIWNGGFEQYQPANHCQFMRGNVFTYTDQNNFPARDIDSYYFTLTEPCSVKITALTTFTFDLWLANYDGCVPTGIFYLPNLPACTPLAPVTQCLPAGTYTINISPNFFSGAPSQLPYLFVIEEFPCSGCKIESSFQIPASFYTGSCQGNDNSLRPSQDATYCIVVPYYSDWTFSLSSGPTSWDSYMYLTSACNAQIIAQDDNGGENGMSKIECLTLNAGNYYLTVEGFSASDCGNFQMDITECLGSCCYGNDYYNRQCSFGTLSACNSLGGEFTLGQACTPEVCGVRPQCEEGSQLSQLPHLPTEAWTAVASDTYINYGLWENYSAPGVISSIRFWGLFTDYNNGQPCINQPCSFQVTFVDSANGPAVQTYFASAIGYQVPQNYGAQFPIYQYDVDLPTDCSILSGRVNVKSIDGDACVFAWVSSPQGNGSVILQTTSGPVDLPMDVAFCLERGCPKPDSVVIRLAATDTYDILFHLPEASYVRLYYSDNINAVYPATYSELLAGSLPAGNWFGTDNTAVPNRRYIITAQCGPPPIAGEGSIAPFVRIE